MNREDFASAEALFARYSRAMLGAAMKAAGNPHDAEDIVSMSWLKLLRHMPALLQMEERAQAVYILRCVKNEGVSLLRARRRERVRDERLQPVQVGPSEPMSPGSALEDLVEGLAPRERQAVTLRIAGLDNREIARRMNVRESTVRVYLHRAHRHMSDRVRGDCAD